MSIIKFTRPSQPPVLRRLPILAMETLSIQERLVAGISIERLYRAHITPSTPGQPHRTVFVEAVNDTAALRKVREVLAALENRSAKHLAECEAVYECRSALELMQQGVSDDLDARLFETAGARDGKVVSFIRHPVFLLQDPAPLTRKWAQIQAGAS